MHKKVAAFPVGRNAPPIAELRVDADDSIFLYLLKGRCFVH